MPAAVVVGVGAIEHLAPVFENGHQAAVIECLAEELLEEIDDPQSVDGGFDPQVMGGGHQLAARRNTQPLTILLELEDTYLAVLEAVPDQLVFGQLRRVPRRAMSRQVGRRCGGNEALPARADGHRDHRSEERRVGKEGRSRGARGAYTKSSRGKR